LLRGHHTLTTKTSPNTPISASNIMEKVSIDSDILLQVIQRLGDAVDICYTAPENPKEEGYPYATGYSRAAMQGVIETLQQYMVE